MITKETARQIYNCHQQIEEIGKIWLKHTTLYVSEDDGDFMKALSKLQKNGVSIRTLEAITGIPRSTLSYRFNKEGKLDE